MPSTILPVMLLIGLGVVFALLTRRVSQRLGRSADRFGTGDTAHDFVGRVYRIGGAILFVFLLVRVVLPTADMAVGLIPVLAQPAISWLGLVVMAAGSAVILAAQVQMGMSWRIGVDHERTGLVTAGLFAWSRNPTFLGMMAVAVGAFLMAPTAITGIVLAAAWVAFSLQIRMEEEHLQRMHGVTYDRYRAAVPRWIALRPSARADAARGSPVDQG